MTLNELPKDFDRDYYLAVHQDVADAGIDPVTHYLQYGYHEGRDFKPISEMLKPRMGDDLFDHDGLQSVHNHDFMIDSRFAAAYDRGVRAAGSDYKWFWRVHLGLWAANTAIKLQGDFVECGVNRGFLSSAIMQQLNWDTHGRQFYLMDTFQGIDLKYLSDVEIKGGVLDRNNSDIAKGFYTQNLNEVKTNFSEWKNTTMVVGSIPDTLPQVKSDKIAFVHIDMNCTEPEVAALEYFWNKMSTGAIVLLDDYAYFGFHPQKEGMDAWASKHDVAIASLPTGQGLIIKT